MKQLYYEMIFKRKSFHIFKDTGTISSEEIQDIEETYRTLRPLVNDIRTEARILPPVHAILSRGKY